MKHVKRMMAFLMAAIMAVPLICTAALAEEGTVSFTINQKDAGYGYVLYQMFTGDVSMNPDFVEGTSDPNDKYIISNIVWGNSVPESTQVAMYDYYQLTGKDRTAAKFAEEMARKASNSENIFHDMMVEMARLNKTNGQSLVSGTPMSYDEVNENYSVSGLVPGYYFVMNTSVPNESAAYSDYIIKLAGEDVVAEPKQSNVTAFKKVDDINQSTAAVRTTNLDSSDANIGTIINYTLTSNLPGNIDAYKQTGAKAFRIIFEDDMSKGLTWYTDDTQTEGYATIQFGANGAEIPVNFEVVPEGTKAMVDGKEIDIKTDYEGGKLWKLDIANLMTFAQQHNITDEIAANAPVTIKYRAILNSAAVTTNSGNPNTYRVIFEANPNYHGEYLSTTEKDTNIVFTYKAIFNKIDDGNNPLKGADFKLEKFVTSSTGATTVTIDGVEYNGTWVDVTELNPDTKVNPAKTTNAQGDDATQFTFIGLDDGHYRLIETKTPTGYNTIEPREFDIVATHIDGDTPTLDSLTGTFTNWTKDDGSNADLTANIPSASLTANVVNRQGITLPASGGMGTTLLYVVGGILVVGSAVALVVKRRAQAE